MVPNYRSLIAPTWTPTVCKKRPKTSTKAIITPTFWGLVKSIVRLLRNVGDIRLGSSRHLKLGLTGIVVVAIGDT